MRRPIRVLGVFPALAGDVGGIQKVGRMAWEAIRRHVEDPRDAVLFHYGRGQRVAEAFGSEVIEVTSRRAAVSAALRLRVAPRLVVFGHPTLVQLVPFLQLSGARVLAFLFGVDAWRRQGIISRMLFKRVDLFLPISDYTWQRFAQANPSLAGARHRTVWLGAESPLAAPVPRPQSPPAVLMIGRLVRSEDYKGHREMIEAWPFVRGRISGAELWIAGDGDLRPILEQRVRQLGLQDSVRFWGRVTDEMKVQLLVRCSCLAMPSHGEGFGLVYVEAMRVGRPCLVSGLDAGREVVNPPAGGLIANRDHPEELAAAICQLLTPGPGWDHWSQAARRRYETLFSAAHFEERFLRALAGA